MKKLAGIRKIKRSIDLEYTYWIDVELKVELGGYEKTKQI